MKTEKQIKYLQILNSQRNSGKISEKKFKKEIKWFRKNITIPDFI
jgi:hypothetical protein